MSFLLYRYRGEEDDLDGFDDKSGHNQCKSNDERPMRQDPAASADARVVGSSPSKDGGGGAACWVWSFEQLKRSLDSDREVSNAWSSYLNHALRSKLLMQNSSHNRNFRPDSGGTAGKSRETPATNVQAKTATSQNQSSGN